MAEDEYVNALLILSYLSPSVLSLHGLAWFKMSVRYTCIHISIETNIDLVDGDKMADSRVFGFHMSPSVHYEDAGMAELAQYFANIRHSLSAVEMLFLVFWSRFGRRASSWTLQSLFLIKFPFVCACALLSDQRK